MNKILFALFITVMSAISATTIAFEVNNNLLNKLYEKVDAMYETQPERVMHAYKNLPRVKILTAKNPEVTYYLDKIAAYIHGKLFTFTEQPNFVCRDSYVQKGDTVEIDYTIKDIDGNLIVTSLEEVAKEMWSTITIENPLGFNAWSEYVLPGINNTVYWTQVWKNSWGFVPAIDAYGNYEDSKRITFEGSIPAEIQVSTIGWKVMMKVTIDDKTYALIGVVIEKTATSATVDFNHPHAGKDIMLSLEVLKLFKACK